MTTAFVDAPGQGSAGVRSASPQTAGAARFPLEALRVHLGCSWRQLQTLMRVNGGVLNAFRERGLDIYQADRYAMRCGEFHPSEVWPEWMLVVVDDLEGDEVLVCA